MNKRKISVRLTESNYELVELLANTIFWSESTGSNFSEALNFILNIINNSNIKDFLVFLRFKYRFDNGERTKEVIEGNKEFYRLLNVTLEITKNNPKDTN